MRYPACQGFWTKSRPEGGGPIRSKSGGGKWVLFGIFGVIIPGEISTSFRAMGSAWGATRRSASDKADVGDIRHEPTIN